MDWRLRRPSTVIDVALRARRDSVNAARISTERRASIAAFKDIAPGFKYPVLDHITMFKVKDDADPGEVAAMVEAFHGLRKLDGVQELTVGTALSVQGGDYTHVLHGRFRDRRALASFRANPDYVKIVKKSLTPLTEDMITVDWECMPYGPVLDFIAAKRITLVKVKEGALPADVRFLKESIPRLPSQYPTIGQVSAGILLASEKAKGFSFGILEAFPSTEDEDEVYQSVEHIAWQDTKIRPVAGALLLADFHAQRPAASSSSTSALPVNRYNFGPRAVREISPPPPPDLKIVGFTNLQKPES